MIKGGAGNLIVCEVVQLHIHEGVLDSNGAIDQLKLDLVARAGGSYYSRAKAGFFEIPKPFIYFRNRYRSNSGRD